MVSYFINKLYFYSNLNLTNLNSIFNLKILFIKDQTYSKSEVEDIKIKNLNMKDVTEIYWWIRKKKQKNGLKILLNKRLLNQLVWI